MLEIKNISVELKGSDKHFLILRNVSLSLKKGEIIGIAGESGSGKTILAKTILNIITKPVVKTGGEIILDGKPIVTEQDFRQIRGDRISMIFQNPTASLNPVFTIGDQITEAIRTHNPEISVKEAMERAEQLLSEVEIPHPKERLRAYPHQLSGGMNQRVMIAIALSSNPEVLIADEPTTALDVTIQMQIISLLKRLNQEKELSVIFITHDLELLANTAGTCYIMYAGEIMEKLSSEDLKSGNIRHPYTKSLKACVPQIGEKREYLNTIQGTITFNGNEFADKCVFSGRCDRATEKCFKEKPVFSDGFSCHNPY